MKKVIKISSRLTITLMLLSLTLLFIMINKAKNEALPENNQDISKTQIYANDGTLIYEIGNKNNNQWVSIEEMPKHLINAFLAIEDHNFFEHNGFEYKRVIKAITKNITSLSKKEGASTITQQYARNLYLTPTKSYKRKMLEAYYTIMLENNYTKEKILEGYLNTIYFGHGLYGINQAALYYFNKEVNSLNLLESASLAALPKAPENLSPIKNPEKNKERRKLVLKQMIKRKLIDVQTAYTIMNNELPIHGKLPPTESQYNAEYFRDIVLDEFNNLNLGKVNTQNLKIYTTLDINITENIQEAVESTIPKTSEIQTAIIAIDPNTGAIKSLIGGKNYTESSYNRATAKTRHPGSTIKPFLYYQALESGFSPLTTFKSSPSTFYVNDGAKFYAPQNYNNEYANKDITMHYALATSDNIYAVKTHLYLGEEKLAQMLQKCGFDDNVKPLPSLALGATETSLLQMLKSYSTLANTGYSVSPMYITHITDGQDNIVYENKIIKKRILNEKTTYVLNEMMTGMFDTNMNTGPLNVTGSSIKAFISRKYAGKSGSTDFDNWMIGYTPDLIIGVWSGYDEPKPIPSTETSYAKKIWVKSIEKSLSNDTFTWYEVPQGVKTTLVEPITGIYSEQSRKKIIYYIKNN